MYKKRALAILICICLASCLLAGCSFSKDSGAKEAAEGFLNGLKNADASEIKKYSTDGAMSEDDMEVFDTKTFETELYKNMGIDKSILNEEVQSEMTALCESLAKNFVTDYEITDVSESKSTATVQAKVTYGYNIDNIMEGESFDRALEDILTDYQENHLEDLTAVYLAEGEAAMYAKLYNDIMPQIITLIRNQIENETPLQEDLQLRVEKADDAWKVTEAYTYVEED